MQRGYDASPIITSDLLQAIWREERLPTPREQADNAVRLLGARQESPDAFCSIKAEELSSEVGAAFSQTDDGWSWLVNHLVTQGLVEPKRTPAEGMVFLRLTFNGWDRFAELQRSIPNSRKAFMAMKFGDDIADRVFREHFKPAVALAGFDLVRLDENPKAGLIDHRLEVEIRASRFLVADLTYGNAGAYWEAGFAAGLGRPVFYTCEKGHFSKEKTHFDTNHHFTIVWDAATPGVAAGQLKDAIRATLPAEAKLGDA